MAPLLPKSSETDSTALPYLVGNEGLIDIKPGTYQGQPIKDYGVLPSSSSNTVSDLPPDAGERLQRELTAATEAIRELTKAQRAQQRPESTEKPPVKEKPGTSEQPTASPINYTELFERLGPGLIVFNPSPTMTVGKPERIVVQPHS